MTLAGTDLPDGVSVARQGYVDDRESLASYDRQFETSSARFRGSVLTSLESDVSLLRSPAEAGGFLLLLRSIYASPRIGQDFAQAFSEGAGVRVRGVRIETRKSVSAGDESTAIVVRYSFGGQAFRFAIVHVRVNRVIGTLIVTGSPSKFHFADVEPLAGKLAQRIGDGL